MRIEQQNNIIEMLQQNSGVEDKGGMGIFKEKIAASKSKHSDSQSVFIKDSTYLNPTLAEKEDIAEEIGMGASLDATARKNQMAVLSHTTSEEDYQKMQEEGFSLDTTTGNTIVTVTDKIKMQIAKAGGDISCFGDDLSAAEIEEITGNAALASQIEAALKEADLPVTEENMKSCMEAYYLADTLGPLSEGGMKYLLNNELEPTVENFYKATYSGSANSVVPAMDNNYFGMKTQIENIIKQAGFPVNEQTLNDCNWLLSNDMVLTTKSLTYLENLKAYTGEVSGDELIHSLVSALAEGKTPKEAMMIPGYSLVERAQEAASVIENATDADLQYLIDKGQELTISNLKMASAQEKGDIVFNDNDLRLLTARRQLEETRLVMTVEANYSLLKRGISIDIKPLVELVEELKSEENLYYEKLLDAQGVDYTESTVTAFAETTKKLNAIQTVPAYVLGMPKAEVSNIRGVYDKGMALKTAFEKANESYETLMTAPRSDMGDSYKKAFRNVDDILEDLNLERSEENRRAVRILAYNQLEINEQTILEMKAADEEVQRVFKNLKPGVIVEMLRRGENPLEMDFAQLNRITEEIKRDMDGNDSERFSEFLWKLEKNNAISEDERKSFIGIYRLIHQVEQTDGAAIGALVNQGADLTLKNLLTAVRSGNKQKNMDIVVDESYGERAHSNGYENSIIDQIMAAYQGNCLKDVRDSLTPGKLSALSKSQADWMEMTPEQLAKALSEVDGAEQELEMVYAKEQLASLKQCAETSEEVYRLLERYDIPNSVQNVLAMEALISDRNQLFRKLFGNMQDNKDASLSDTSAAGGDVIDTGEEEFDWQTELKSIRQQLIKDLGNSISEPKELAEAQEALGKLAENVMKTMMESDTVTSIDIREARLMQAQISLQKQMAKKETYSVPVLVGDEVTNVTLKIVRGVEKRGVVDIMLESKYAGKIAATFQAKEHGITGMIVSDRNETKEDMEERLADIISGLGEEAEVHVAYMKDLNLMQFSNGAVEKGDMLNDLAEGKSTAKSVEQKETLENGAFEVQTTRLYRIAESFIKVIKQNYK